MRVLPCRLVWVEDMSAYESFYVAMSLSVDNKCIAPLCFGRKFAPLSTTMRARILAKQFAKSTQQKLALNSSAYNKPHCGGTVFLW